MKQSTFSAVMANSIKNLLQGYTKGIRFTAILTLLFTIGVGQIWGADVTYKVTSTSAVSTSGTAPTGSSAAYSQTYTTTACQITSGNSATLTLTGLGGINISNITLSMKSNSSKGAGKLSYSIDGGSTWTYIVGSSSSTVNFNNSAWNGSYTTSYTNISKNVTISNVTKLKIKIEATTNSLYCQSYKITYTAAVTNKTVYLKPTSAWDNTNAKFAVYYFNNSTNTNGWSSLMTKVDNKCNNDVYKAEIPSSYTNLIFVRLNNTATAGDWNKKWDQTADLTLSGTNNMYTISAHGPNGGKASGSWSAYKEEVQVTYNFQKTGISNVTECVIKGQTTANKSYNLLGWKLEGWYKEAACTNQWNFSTTVTSEMTLYAKWSEPATTTVYLNANSNNVNWTQDNADIWVHAFMSSTGEYKDIQLTPVNTCDVNWLKAEGIPYGVDKLIFLRVADGAGVVWSGSNLWNQAAEIGYSGSTSYYQMDNWSAVKTATAYQPSTYTISYNSGGGTGSMASTTVECDGSITLPANSFTRTGYTFNGWKDAGGKTYTDKATISNVKSNITLTAQWKANTYTITLNGNNGSGHTASVTATYNSATLSPSTITNPTRAGYTFGGWYSASGGTGSMVIGTDGKLQANVSDYTGANGIWIATASKILYAKWTPITYYVKFNANGGSGSMSNQTFTYGTAQNLTLNAFTRTGYTFAGWNTKADGSGTNYADKASVNNLSTTNGAIVNLYAKWTKVHTITWKVNEQQYGEKQEVVDGQTIGSLPDTPDAPTSCSDKVFMGWTESATVDSNGTGITYISDSTKPDGDKTYHAVFATKEGGSTSLVTDKLTRATTGISNGSGYGTWSGKKATSSAVYAGQSAGGNDAIQIRTTNSNSGIISTTSGGKITKVSVVWNSNTSSGRTLNVYGKNSAYSAATDLYDTSKDGDMLGTIVYGTSEELTISGDYEYIGLRSASGAMYLTSVSITWSVGSEPTYTEYVTSCTPQFTITLNPNGGTIDDNDWKYDNGTGYYTQTVSEGTVLNFPTATKTGYTNIGWKDNLGDAVTSITVSENATYTAAYDCALATVGISGTYALTVGDVFELVATAYDSNGDVLTCPANTTYSWERYNSVDEVWEVITNDNSDDDAKLTFNNCQIANCGTYRCHVSYGECKASSHTTAADGGFNVHCFHLKGDFEGDWNIEYAFNHTDEPGIATLTLDLISGRIHNFKIYDGISQYGNGGTISTSVTDWTYGSDNNSNTILETGADGSYVFTLNYTQLINNSTNILVLDVTYPPSNQSEGYTVYYDNLVHNWQNVYYRIGHTGHNQNAQMELVRGTSHLYKCTTPEYNDFEAWQVANNVAWSGTHSIYNVNTNDEYAITHATEYKKFVVVEDLTLTPEATGSYNSTENCTYYPAAKQSGMKTWKATVIPAVGGTITVKYTHHDGTAVTDFISGDRDLAHTCLLTITATPDAGYKLGTLTVNDVAFTSGNVHTLTEDTEIKVTWTEKSIPTFKWSADSYTAALEADNNYPTLDNPNSLSVTYKSSNENVAKIDANGKITLGAEGKTTITAIGAESTTHKSATTTYELTVVKSNCRWVEVEIGDITYGDDALIAVPGIDATSGDAILNMLQDPQAATNPTIRTIKVIDLLNGTNVPTTVIWNIRKRDDNQAYFTVYRNGSNTDRLAFISNYGVRVGGNNADSIFTITPDKYLKSITSNEYLRTAASDWRHYSANTTQPFKFYKRECLDSEHYWVTWDAGEGLWTDGSSKKLESYEVGATITKPADPTREGYRFDGWTPAPGTMPAENKTFTAQWTKVYKITWYENGVPSYTYVPSDNAVVTWEDNIADCGEKKFYGWTADDTFVSDPTTPPTLISKGTTIAGDVTYYAVYADAVKPANPGYTKVTTISEGTYLIATGETSSDKAYTGKYSGKTYGGTCDVVVENQVIKNKPNDALEVTVTLGTGSNAGKFAIYDGTYYLSAPSSNDLTFNSSVTYDWKLTSEGYINSTSQTSRYIQLNSSANPIRFACYTGTQKYAYLYKKQTTTYKNFAVSCATYDISVTTPTGGTVTTTPADEAGAGQEITINVTPDDCKYLTALKYNDGSDHSINIASTPYTFTMPAADVTVTATFADKIATDIEILTSAHRLLMQGSAFVGEQVRITYNNGDKETLNWNDSRLTFTGHNTATLGSQTVTVTYNDCGTQSASYNIEVIDGLGITFWDGDYTETIKYEPGDLVDVDNRIGQNICSGWEFAGWSETKVANESEEYVPVHNFNATDAKVLYAVYVKKKEQWTTIVTADEAKSGAKYVLAYDRYGTYYALTSSVKDVNYLAGKVVTSTEGKLNSFDVYYLSAEPTADLIWELASTDENGKWYLYNKNTAKYIDLSTQGQIHLTDLPSDKLQMESGYNDSQIRIASSTVPTYYLSWDNSNTRYNTYASSNSQEYWYTKDEEFTSTPPCSPLSATFHGNGGIVTDGVNSGDDLTITEPTRDAGITTPTASFDDCNGKSWTFVGWAREEIDVTRVPVLTTDLLHDGDGNKQYKIQEDGEEFWAVFTNTGDPETKYGTITFTDADVTRQYENAKTITKSVTAMGDYDFELYHVSNASSKGIQFDHEVATRGYIKNITSLGKINSISLNEFQVGDINDVKVYVGNTPNAINTLLTEADLQQTGDTYTYYPPKNYAYVKIEATGYCGITSISIDFGKGTQIWATTPNCSDIFLSGNELYVTSTKGQSIRAAERLTVKAVQLESKAKVVISSNSSDIYFSDVLDANFTQAVKPTETLTLTAGVDGNLAATEIYVHYRPSVDGTGMPEDVVVSANLETPNPSITDDHTIHVRNLPADFVIAAKWDGHWYALPANCTLSQSPTEGLLIEVDNIDDPKMAIAAPASAKFGLKSVYTSNSTNDRYEKNGANLVFVENVTEETPVANQTLYNGSETGIQVYAQYANYHTGNALRYEWTPTTTNLLDYTLTSAHTFTKTDGTPEEARTISLGNNGVFGTLLNDKSYNGEVRLLPATFYEPASAQVLKWKANSVIVMYTGTGTTATTQVGDNAKSAEQTLANQQLTHGIYELTTNQSLTDHAGGELNIYIGTNTRVELEIPLIISGEVTASANAHDVVILENSKLTAAETKYSYKDVYVYGGAKLAIPENTELGVNNIILRAGGVATDGAGQNATYQYIYPQVELKGTLTSAVQNIRYEYVTDNDHWYHLVLPFDGSLASIHYPYEYYGDQVKLDNKGSWIIKRYNGATRAIGNYDAWVDIETEGKTSTTAGQGYIFWGAPKKVTANGAYERPKWGIQRITMLSKVSETINEATKAEKNDKTVSGLSSHKDVPNNSGKVNDQGWNLIGNPYMVNLTGLNSESLKPGKLVEVEDAAGNWTGQWKDNEDGFRYVTIPSDHFDTYTAQRMTAFTEANPMIAGRAFFIQLEDDDAGVTFSAANRASLLAARVAANEPTTDIETGIVLSNETMQDEVNFWIKDGKTNDYEYNADYPKTPNNTNFNIYGVHAHGDLSWVATGPEFAKESMPIGYQVPAAGTYMLSVSEEYYSDEIDALYVTDHEMSPEVTTDLMIAPYEFSVNQAETNNMRFTVSIKLKKDSENDATGLDNININGEEIQKFIYQDKMYILHHGIIYDATGKRVITINK